MVARPVVRCAFSPLTIYGASAVRSAANNTREDGREFLAEAARVPARTHVETLPLDRANDALVEFKRDAIRGAGVPVMKVGND